MTAAYFFILANSSELTLFTEDSVAELKLEHGIHNQVNKFTLYRSKSVRVHARHRHVKRHSIESVEWCVGFEYHLYIFLMEVHKMNDIVI